MFHRVKSVVPEKNFMLLVQFSEGITKQYDVSKLFEKWTAFQALKNTPGLFSCVHVDAGGYGISWNDDVIIPLFFHIVEGYKRNQECML